jgi:hypothetical protein
VTIPFCRRGGTSFSYPEFVLDSTNKHGCELFSVIIPNNSSGVPLAYYLLLERGGVHGERTEAITTFLQEALASFLDPIFFHTDKDLGQITAMKEAFPQATVTLCYFHVLQAVRRSISSDEYSQLCWENYGMYRPDSNTFPFLEDGFPLEDASHSYKPLPKSTREGLLNLVGSIIIGTLEFRTMRPTLFFRQKRFTFNAFEKCTPIASQIPFLIFGYTFGPIGTPRISLGFGAFQVIPWYVSPAPQCSWRRTGERSSAIICKSTTSR